MVAPDNSQLYSDLSLGFLLPSLGSFSNSCGGWRRHGMEGGQGRGKEGRGGGRRGKECQCSDSSTSPPSAVMTGTCPEVEEERTDTPLHG